MSSRNNKSRSHWKLLFGWVIYFALFLVTENCIPPEACTAVYVPLDDRIPFWEGFLIPYVLWYGWIVFSLWWMLRHHVDGFRCLQIYFTLVQLMLMAALPFVVLLQELIVPMHCKMSIRTICSTRRMR